MSGEPPGIEGFDRVLALAALSHVSQDFAHHRGELEPVSGEPRRQRVPGGARMSPDGEIEVRGVGVEAGGAAGQGARDSSGTVSARPARSPATSASVTSRRIPSAVVNSPPPNCDGPPWPCGHPYVWDVTNFVTFSPHTKVKDSCKLRGMTPQATGVRLRVPPLVREASFSGFAQPALPDRRGPTGGGLQPRISISASPVAVCLLWFSAMTLELAFEALLPASGGAARLLVPTGQGVGVGVPQLRERHHPR